MATSQVKTVRKTAPAARSNPIRKTAGKPKAAPAVLKLATGLFPLLGVKRTSRGHRPMLLLTQSGHSRFTIAAAQPGLEPHFAGCKFVL